MTQPVLTLEDGHSRYLEDIAHHTQDAEAAEAGISWGQPTASSDDDIMSQGVQLSQDFLGLKTFLVPFSDAQALPVPLDLGFYPTTA